MSIDVEYPPEQSAASLVSGILSDLQRLVDQQFQLTRREIEVELRRRFAAAAMVAFGVGVLFLAALFQCLTVSHLLHWLASSPGTDSASFPLWACDAVVATVLAVSGVILAGVGRLKFRAIDSLHSFATAELPEISHD